MQKASSWLLASVLGAAATASQAATLEERMAAFEARASAAEKRAAAAEQQTQALARNCNKSNAPRPPHNRWRPPLRSPRSMPVWQNSKPVSKAQRSRAVAPTSPTASASGLRPFGVADQ